MESVDEQQHNEITALKSIYDGDFIEVPEPKAWKGAARQLEFIIKVKHPDDAYAERLYFNLHVRLPRTYPLKAPPIFTIQQPIKGLTPPTVQKLSAAMHAEAQEHVGEEMVFGMVTFCQDWITANVPPPVEVDGSLASQKDKRALEEQQAQRQREQADMLRRRQLVAQENEQLSAQIQEDLQRRLELQRAEKEKLKARHRAGSDATTVPAVGDALVESFGHEIEVKGKRFDSVRLFHAKKECLGVTYLAEPVFDDIHATLPLELHVVTFEDPYYYTHQGRKKLKSVEAEIQNLIGVQHVNLLRAYAVKLIYPSHGSTASTRLAILTEKSPQLTLYDVLQECSSLREKRAADYASQILSALHAIHSATLVHRGISPHCVCLAQGETPSDPKTVKLCKVAYFTRLLNLHKSNPFGPSISAAPAHWDIPDAWLPVEVVDSPLLYNRSRDLHAVGVVLMQMLLGMNVTTKYPDIRSALNSPSMPRSLTSVAATMLLPAKKSDTTCLSLLAMLTDNTPPTSIPVTETTVNGEIMTPMPRQRFAKEVDYFGSAPKVRHSSRWKEDWEELELLGKGGFGSVVKARNKIDGRVYAVKKIRLRALGDQKIYREVNAISRLSHRFIVRYYTTWVETAEIPVTPHRSPMDSDPEETETETGSGDREEDNTRRSTSLTRSDSFGSNPFTINLDELSHSGGHSSSFPSIHFTRSNSPMSPADSSSEGSDEAAAITSLAAVEVSLRLEQPLEHSPSPHLSPLPGLRPLPRPRLSHGPTMTRTLYIQMEFVERQTLKERVDEGLSEEGSWKLFQQIVEALAYMSNMNILHRDIKLTNIFIDRQGDCKIGDFGLATSSLAAVDPSDVGPHVLPRAADMTLDVGTTLYIAPEVLSRRKGPRDHSKADMYSLGIVFFEMNYKFSTAVERIKVLEKLRRPEVIFPEDWEASRSRQKEIIEQLLRHDPAARPTASQISKSPLMPFHLEDYNIGSALQTMVDPNSTHYSSLLSALFSQQPQFLRALTYDSQEVPEHAPLFDKVQDRMAEIFRLHGAVDMEPPLLVPVMESRSDDDRVATLLDRRGELLTLRSNLLVPFARLAARQNLRRIKRFHIGNIFQDVPGTHPRAMKFAVCDVITPDIAMGPLASTAEMLTITQEILAAFPTCSQNFDLCVSHSKLSEIALDRVPLECRSYVVDLFTKQTKSSTSQKRALLLKKGLLRSVVDDLEILNETDLFSSTCSKLEKLTPAMLAAIEPALSEIKIVVEFAVATGVTRPIYFRPLMLGEHHVYFKDGVHFEVFRRNKRYDILAAGGRYDRLISSLSPPAMRNEQLCAIGLQMSLEKITLSLAAYQASVVHTLIKEQRSFGFWSPSRCDVYVVSYQAGFLQERIEVATILWQHGISADVMYESALAPDAEDHIEMCEREGILFTVYPRRVARRDQPPVLIFKVKSILKGTENEVSRQDLVAWLQQQIVEQKRMDASTSGVQSPMESLATVTTPMREHTISSDMVQLILPNSEGNLKKQRKATKAVFWEKSSEMYESLRTGMQAGVPMVSVDVSTATLEALGKLAPSSRWLTDDEAWRAALNSEPVCLAQHAGYLGTVREAIARKKAEGHRFLLIFGVRDETVLLLTLS